MPFNEYNIKFLALYAIQLRDTTNINPDNLMLMLELNELEKFNRRIGKNNY